MLLTFYIQGVLQLKNNSGAKRLITLAWCVTWINKQFLPVLRGRANFGNISKGRYGYCEAEITLFLCYDNYINTLKL